MAVNVISDKSSARHLLEFLSYGPPFPPEPPQLYCAHYLPSTPFFVFSLWPEGVYLKSHQSILSLLSRKSSSAKALFLTCTCDLQLACSLINVLLVGAIVRHFVFMASEMINSNAVFYAKL